MSITAANYPTIAAGDLLEPDHANKLRDAIRDIVNEFDAPPANPSAFDDEFEGPALASQWGSWIGAGEPTVSPEDVTIDDRRLEVVVGPDTNNDGNLNSDAHILPMLAPVPSGGQFTTYSITTKITKPNIVFPAGSWRVGVWLDDDPAIGNAPADEALLVQFSCGLAASGPGVVISTRTGGSLTSFDKERLVNVLELYFRVVVDTGAETVTVYASTTGTPWTEIRRTGSPTNYDVSGWNGGRPQRIGLLFWSHHSGTGFTQYPAIVHYFRVVDGA